MSTPKNTSIPLVTLATVLSIVIITLLIIASAIILRRRQKSRQRAQKDLEAQRAQEMTTFHVNHQALREEQQRRARARLRATKLGIVDEEAGTGIRGEVKKDIRPEDFPLPPTPKKTESGESGGRRYVMPTVEEINEVVEEEKAKMPPPPPPVYTKRTGYAKKSEGPKKSKFKEHIDDEGPSDAMVEKIVKENGEGFDDVDLDDGGLKSSEIPSQWGRPLPSWGRR